VLVDNAHPARPGDTLIVSVTGLTDQWTPTATLSNVEIEVCDSTGTPIALEAALQISPGAAPGAYQIQFTLDPTIPFGPDQTLRVGIGARLSLAYVLPIIPR